MASPLDAVGFPLKFPSLNKTLNYQEDIQIGWQAIMSSLFQLFSTPINSLPLTPSIGFDLDEFLWRIEDSTERGDLETELNSQIQKVTGSADIDTKVSYSGTTVMIDITYRKDLMEENLPVRIDRNTKAVKIRDILVR